MIPYGKQQLNQQDIQAVVDVLNSDFLTQGPQVPLFEQALIDHCKVKHAVAVNSATSALHIACLALGLNKNDVVWTSPISYVASANCALYCGAKIDFIDIDPETYNLSIEKLQQKLIDAKKHHQPLPKIVIPIHLSGLSCDMEKLRALSLEYNFSIIEDASHAIGGEYQGTAIGNCQFSDICVFSFHPVKIVTTAEGGAATTNSDELYQKMLLLRSHGVTREEDLLTEASHGPWYYQQITLGFNYRMSEIHAALGVSQFKRLGEFVMQRNVIAERYNLAFKDLPIRLPFASDQTTSACHLYIIRLKLNLINQTHLEVYNTLLDKGLGVNLHYIPIYKQPHFKKMGFIEADYPESEKYYSEAISIPLYPHLTEDEISRIIDTVKSSLNHS